MPLGHHEEAARSIFDSPLSGAAGRQVLWVVAQAAISSLLHPKDVSRVVINFWCVNYVPLHAASQAGVCDILD